MEKFREYFTMVKRGEVQTTLSEGMCIPVSLTVLGLVQIQEDAI